MYEQIAVARENPNGGHIYQRAVNVHADGHKWFPVYKRVGETAQMDLTARYEAELQALREGGDTLERELNEARARIAFLNPLAERWNDAFTRNLTPEDAEARLNELYVELVETRRSRGEYIRQRTAADQALRQRERDLEAMQELSRVREQRIDELVGQVDTLNEELAVLREQLIERSGRADDLEGEIADLCARHARREIDWDEEGRLRYRQGFDAGHLAAWQQGMEEGAKLAVEQAEKQFRGEFSLKLHRLAEDIRRGDVHPSTNREHVRD